MPNHVKNVLTFKNLKEDEKKMLLNAVAVKSEKDLSEYEIDFNKIIPEPDKKSECPEEYLRSERSGVEAYMEKPWFNWYEWHCDKWGTKWNAYDCYTRVESDMITFVFSTAWSAPFNIIYKLALFGLDFELKYADEDLGSNCGRMIFEPENDDIHGIKIEKESSQFAEELWDLY